ncbi:hypothetical protein C7T94_02310 [Pedobacter yulinensis]|uniref:Uncharacterized protein n=1 Tax=Pedobacter yulinensis TaxID=2126353 RepID=A0A2T3HR90_9SPHI|nr:hypothetical protein C7T94_02310 [Pedobacter yulinensis]
MAGRQPYCTGSAFPLATATAAASESQIHRFDQGPLRMPAKASSSDDATLCCRRQQVHSLEKLSTTVFSPACR